MSMATQIFIVLAASLTAYRYPWFLETWDNYPFNIERADAIRYFVLAHYGGVYIDLDDVSVKPQKIHKFYTDGTFRDVNAGSILSSLIPLGFVARNQLASQTT